ncbi:MAG: LuxR C-terminal-related transcriptional regulator [Acidimicrobiales bacterium]
MADTVQELVERGSLALRQGDSTAAREAFTAASGRGAEGSVLAGLAQADYLDHCNDDAIEGWERAYAAFRSEQDHVQASRVAQRLSYMHGMIRGDRAVMNGWLARAETLMDGAEHTVAAGWAAFSKGLFEDDPDRRERLFRDALESARHFDDSDLEMSSLAYLGAALVHQDRTEEGMLLLDEALAALAGHEVDDFLVIQEVFCQLFAACEHANDIARAEQWIRIGEAMATQRQLPAVAAFCHAHYGGIMTAAGRWPEADLALTEAVRLFGLGPRSQRAASLARLANLRVLQGRLEEAEQLLIDAELGLDPEAAVPTAALHLARGEHALAREVLEQTLGHMDESGGAAARALCLLVDVLLAEQRHDEAAQAADRLLDMARRHPTAFLRAVAALARGRVCLASGTGDPQVCLREALAGFADAQMPADAALARLDLARVLAETHPEVALAEARAAHDAFERLQAARQVDAAAAVLRSLGSRTPSARRGGGVLTKREAEVLDLLGHGLSNPEIAERLYISRKTVEHHVSNVLAKLGLRSRAEAAAHAARMGPGTQ